jgi:hypothetical protein
LLSLSPVHAYEGDGYRDFLLEHGYLEDVSGRSEGNYFECYRITSSDLKPEHELEWREIGSQWYPLTVSDGEGITYIAWSEGNSRIYMAAVDASGHTLWGPIAANPAITSQSDYRLISRGAEGVILSWTERSYGCGEQNLRDTVLKAQKFSPDGSRGWGKGGLTIHKSQWGYVHRLLPSGTDGAIVVWHDWTDAITVLTAVFAQRIDGEGNKLWSEQGQKIGLPVLAKSQGLNFVSTEESGLMLALGGGITGWGTGYHAALLVSSDGDPQTIDKKGRYGGGRYRYLMRAETDGATLLVKDRGRIMKGRRKEKYFVVLRLDDQGLVVWRALFKDKAGIPGYEYSDGRICGLVSDGSGGVIAVWSYNSTKDSLFLAQRVSKEGKIQWQAPVVLGKGPFGSRISVAPDGAGGVYATWITYQMSRHSQWPARQKIIFQDIRIQRVDSEGERTWNGPAFVASNIGKTVDRDFPAIVSDGKGGAVVAWTDGRAGFENLPMSQDDLLEPEWLAEDPQAVGRIYLQQVSASGEMAWQDDGIKVGSPEAPESCLERTSPAPIVGARAVNLRTEPSLTSDILKPLRRGTELGVLERSESCLTINGRPGRWVRVQEQAVDDSEGWVFDAYLVYPQHADPFAIWPMVP